MNFDTIIVNLSNHCSNIAKRFYRDNAVRNYKASGSDYIATDMRVLVPNTEMELEIRALQFDLATSQETRYNNMHEIYNVFGFRNPARYEGLNELFSYKDSFQDWSVEEKDFVKSIFEKCYPTVLTGGDEKISISYNILNPEEADEDITEGMYGVIVLVTSDKNFLAFQIS